MALDDYELAALDVDNIVSQKIFVIHIQSLDVAAFPQLLLHSTSGCTTEPMMLPKVQLHPMTNCCR
jgi:hypothetical protein